MWKNQYYYEVSVEERMVLNFRLEEAYKKRGVHITVETECNQFAPEPYMACMNYFHNIEEYSFHCGSFWYEEQNILPVLAMAHELGHYIDVSENFYHNHKEYHSTLGTRELEVRAWLHAVEVCKEIGFTRWEVFYKYAMDCLSSYFNDPFGFMDYRWGYTGENPTLENGLMRIKEMIGIEFSHEVSNTTRTVKVDHFAKMLRELEFGGSEKNKEKSHDMFFNSLYQSEREELTMKETLIEIIGTHQSLDFKKHLIQQVIELFDHIEELEDDSYKLSCLEGAGVDNWSGYDYAMEMYREEE